MLKKFVCFIIIVVSLYFAYSCSQGVKGNFLLSVDIGTNTNHFLIWTTYQGSNYFFSSFQELFSSQIDDQIKNYFDDGFFVIFYPDNSGVFLVNQLPSQLKLIESYRDRTVLDYFPLDSDNYVVQDMFVSPEGSILLLLFNTETPSEDYVYYLAFIDKTTKKLSIFDMPFTNIVKVDSDDMGNFYIFQLPKDDLLKIDVFSSAFIMLPSAVVYFTNLTVSNISFSSAVVTKPFQILLKFDSIDNLQKSFIFSFDYNSKELSKKYEIYLPKENFTMMQFLKNGFVSCASYKNGFPVVMFFNPFDTSFRISHEIYVDFQYPTLMRGFKITREGKLVASFLDFPDNKILFYYWDLVTVK